MSATDVLSKAECLGIQITAKGSKLKLSGTQESQQDAHFLKEEVVRHKKEIMSRIASPIFLSVQTRSALKPVVEGKRYAFDPSTEILTCAFAVDEDIYIWIPAVTMEVSQQGLLESEWLLDPNSSRVIHLFTGGQLPGVLAELLNSGRNICVHSPRRTTESIWQAKGLPQPSGWINTFHLARSVNLPDHLEELTVRLGYRSVRHNPNFIQTGLLSNIYDLTGEPGPKWQASELQDLLDELDQLEHIHSQLIWCMEAEVLQADWAINHRGVRVDTDLVENLLDLQHRMNDRIADQLHSMTNDSFTIRDLSRDDWLFNWLERQGVRLPDLKKKTVESLLAGTLAEGGPVNAMVECVLSSRLLVTKNNESRLRRLKEEVTLDGRVFDLYEYQKCHTGRWTGRGIQPQNLPKPHPEIINLPALIENSSDYESFQAELPEGVSVADGISSLLRTCLVPSTGNCFCIADLCSIEARVLAWCAEEEQMMQVFQNGVDIYCVLASRIFSIHVTRAQESLRNIGKVAVLGCGYGMSARAFDDFAAANGVDLVKSGITAHQVVQGYRNSFPKISGSGGNGTGGTTGSGVWQRVECAAREAIISRGTTYYAAKCTFTYEENALCVILPSRRRIYYRNARLEADSHGIRKVIKYDRSDHTNHSMYGAKIAENIVQAISRDLLAGVMVKCEETALPIVLHNHDEVVIEATADRAPQALEELLRIMSTTPAWADGLPLEVEGYVVSRYCKSLQRDTDLVTARNGQILRSFS